MKKNKKLETTNSLETEIKESPKSTNSKTETKEPLKRRNSELEREERLKLRNDKKMQTTSVIKRKKKLVKDQKEELQVSAPHVNVIAHIEISPTLEKQLEEKKDPLQNHNNSDIEVNPLAQTTLFAEEKSLLTKEVNLMLHHENKEPHNFSLSFEEEIKEEVPPTFSQNPHTNINANFKLDDLSTSQKPKESSKKELPKPNFISEETPPKNKKESKKDLPTKTLRLDKHEEIEANKEPSLKNPSKQSYLTWGLNKLRAIPSAFQTSMGQAVNDVLAPSTHLRTSSKPKNK